MLCAITEARKLPDKAGGVAEEGGAGDHRAAHSYTLLENTVVVGPYSCNCLSWCCRSGTRPATRRSCGNGRSKRRLMRSSGCSRRTSTRTTTGHLTSESSSCESARKGSVLDKNTAVAQQTGSAFIFCGLCLVPDLSPLLLVSASCLVRRRSLRVPSLASTSCVRFLPFPTVPQRSTASSDQRMVARRACLLSTASQSECELRETFEKLDKDGSGALGLPRDSHCGWAQLCAPSRQFDGTTVVQARSIWRGFWRCSRRSGSGLRRSRSAQLFTIINGIDAPSSDGHAGRFSMQQLTSRGLQTEVHELRADAAAAEGLLVAAAEAGRAEAEAELASVVSLLKQAELQWEEWHMEHVLEIVAVREAMLGRQQQQGGSPESARLGWQGEDDDVLHDTSSSLATSLGRMAHSEGRQAGGGAVAQSKWGERDEAASDDGGRTPPSTRQGGGADGASAGWRCSFCWPLPGCIILTHGGTVRLLLFLWDRKTSDSFSLQTLAARVVVHDYVASGDGKVSIQAGESVTVLATPSTEWW